MVYKKLILFKLENNLGFFSFKYWLKKCMNVSYYIHTLTNWFGNLGGGELTNITNTRIEKQIS